MSLRCPFGDQARAVDSAPLFKAPLLCRFLGHLHHKTIRRSHDRRPRSAKARNRGREGLGIAEAVYGDLGSARVCFREAGTANAVQFDELSGRRGRARSALGSGRALQR